MFAVIDEEEESSEKKEYQTPVISEQVSNTDNLHLWSIQDLSTVKSRAEDPSTIQFLSIFGMPLTKWDVLLTEGYYIEGLLFNFWTFLGCY